MWRVRDLGSRNGTSIDGVDVHGEHSVSTMRVLRVGESLIVPTLNVAPFHGSAVQIVDEMVIGPSLASSMEAIAGSARSSDTLHVTGASGSGKELAARTFHQAGPHANGPFVAVNCASIPEGLAERLLFGTRRGAYSGAERDEEGYLQAAHGGTLFLDEIAELEPQVQAKLLRAIETRQVLPLGATQPRPVQVRICSASHASLRNEVAAGRFREDLYFRLGRPEIQVPPLRDRREEIPWLVDLELRRSSPAILAHSSFVEQCLLRDWPGNVRELRAEVRAAIREALSNKRSILKGEDLARDAGVPFGAETPGAAQQTPVREGVRELDRAQIEAALEKHDGNVSRSARSLGLHRTQLRRLMARFGVAAKRAGTASHED
jgi:transcriptional regulator with PAS, ATPase and Fis domain